MQTPSIVIHTPERKQYRHLSGISRIPLLSSSCLTAASLHCFAFQLSSIPLINGCEFSDCLIAYHSQEGGVIDLSSITESKSDFEIIRYFVNKLETLEFASELEFSLSDSNQDSAIDLGDEHILSLKVNRSGDLMSFFKESIGITRNSLIIQVNTYLQNPRICFVSILSANSRDVLFL
jgi:hypothetical protein